MAERTALITGALGQDGSLLAKSLLSRGYKVVGIARSLRAGVAEPADPGLDLRVVDLTDLQAVHRLLEEVQPDELYHLAAAHHSSQGATSGGGRELRDRMLATNFLATRTLAEALLEMRPECSLVFAASSQIHTAAAGVLEVDENTPRSPSTFYGHTKCWSMHLLGFLRETAGLRASTAILFNHESIRRNTSFVSRKVTQAVAKAKRGQPTALTLQNIGARADWSSARDVVDALQRMGCAMLPGDYVIGSGQLVSVRYLVESAFESAGLEWECHARFVRDESTPALVARPARIEHALGWRATTPLRAWLREMVDQELALLERDANEGNI